MSGMKRDYDLADAIRELYAGRVEYFAATKAGEGKPELLYLDQRRVRIRRNFHPNLNMDFLVDLIQAGDVAKRWTVYTSPYYTKRRVLSVMLILPKGQGVDCQLKTETTIQRILDEAKAERIVHTYANSIASIYDAEDPTELKLLWNAREGLTEHA